jgi:hypothetical protein
MGQATWIKVKETPYYLKILGNEKKINTNVLYYFSYKGNGDNHFCNNSRVLGGIFQ